VSGGNFCTQCEAEGFRRITYFPDRPDVMAAIWCGSRPTRPLARCSCPTATSWRAAICPSGRHYAVWEDPFPKPSYLFALVAGNLACREDRFVTRSGARWHCASTWSTAQPRQMRHAMRSLVKAMRWDEETFGREYDLDVT
jgi:aminopeptidase N